MTAPSMEVLAPDTCTALLRETSIGRIAVVVDGFPVVFPMNYRLVETVGHVWIALRTRPGNMIDKAGLHAAFEIDNFDPSTREGWSVLVRGALQPVDPETGDIRRSFDPQPWVGGDRESWLFLEPYMVTGRRLRSTPSEWTMPLEAIIGL